MGTVVAFVESQPQDFEGLEGVGLIIVCTAIGGLTGAAVGA